MLVTVGTLLACTSTRREPQPDTSLSKPEPVVVAPLALDAPAALPTELADVPSWQLAQSQDPMDLAQLAEQLGGARLVGVVAEGGKAGLIALRAFEHAPDAHAERGALCVLLPRLLPPHRRIGLAVVERVLQGPRFDEQIHPEGDGQCRDALASIARQPLDPEERDLLTVSQLHIAQRSDVGYDRQE